MRKLNDENMATSCVIFEVSPDQLRRIAERLEQQVRDYAVQGQVIQYSPEPGQLWVYKPDKVGMLQNATVEK